MLNSIKILKRYCKVTLNVFFDKKVFDTYKKEIIYMIDQGSAAFCSSVGHTIK